MWPPINILLLGKNGQLGWELHRTLATLGKVTALDYPDIDLANPESIRPIILDYAAAQDTSAPSPVIINATAYTAVDQAEKLSDLAWAINTTAPGVIAETARSLGSALIHYSTDYVFDSRKGSAYVESDPTNPLNIYGKSKLGGEQAILQAGAAHLIFRTSWVYSLRRGDNFVTKVLSWARQSRSLRIVNDQISNPTWARALAEITTQVLAIGLRSQPQDGRPAVLSGQGQNTSFTHWVAERQGIYHLAGDGYASRYAWAQAILQTYSERDAAFPLPALEPASTSDFPTPATRPLFSALNCDKFANTFGLRLPAWELALHLAMDDIRP